MFIELVASEPASAGECAGCLRVYGGLGCGVQVPGIGRAWGVHFDISGSIVINLKCGEICCSRAPLVCNLRAQSVIGSRPYLLKLWFRTRYRFMIES